MTRITVAVRAALLAAILAACSGPPMSSYDAEKSRIRDALPSDVVCNERGAAGQNRTLTCGNGPLDVTLVGMDAPVRGIDLNISYNEMFGTGSEEIFRELLGLYGMDDAALDTCIRERYFDRSFDSYRVTCTGFGGADLAVQVRQQTRI